MGASVIGPTNAARRRSSRGFSSVRDASSNCDCPAQTQSSSARYRCPNHFCIQMSSWPSLWTPQSTCSTSASDLALPDAPVRNCRNPSDADPDHQEQRIHENEQRDSPLREGRLDARALGLRRRAGQFHSF